MCKKDERQSMNINGTDKLMGKLRRINPLNMTKVHNDFPTETRSIFVGTEKEKNISVKCAPNIRSYEGKSPKRKSKRNNSNKNRNNKKNN